MAKYQPYNIQNLGAGLNRFHTLDRIPVGMSRQLRNLDPLPNDQVKTRRGYEQYYGCLPLRANTFSTSGTTYSITFDSALSIDLSSTTQGPIVVAGELPSAASSDFSGADFNTSYNAHWYSDFKITFRETYASGTSATFDKSATTTGLTSDKVILGWFNSDDPVDLDNTVLAPEQFSINQSNYNVTTTYTSPSNVTGFFGYMQADTEDGRIYVDSWTTPGDASREITSEEHGLANDRFIVRCYEDDTTWKSITPQEITANSSGDITVTFPSTPVNNIRIIILAAESEYITSAGSGTTEISVPSVSEPLNAYQVWISDGDTRTAVSPASISYSASTGSVTLDWAALPTSESVEILWEPLEYAANTIEITGSAAGSDISTTAPEISVWGLCHEGIYKAAAPKGGFTHHIDNYKSETVEHMITALGGNLMKATSYASGGTTYKMRSLSLRGSNRVSGSQVLAPLFTSVDSGRTRGATYDDVSVDADGYAPVTAVAYSGTSGQVDYTFTFDDLTNGASIDSTYIDTNDKLTVRNCGRDVNNGTFQIVQVVGTPSATSVVIRVENSDVTDTSFDESGLAAQGNVFTDRILTTATPVFIAGDTVSSVNTSGNTVVAVDVSVSDYIYVDGVTSAQTISDGINLYVSRTSALLPLQSFPSETVGNDTVGGFVTGDSVRIDGIVQTPKIKYINNLATSALSSLSVASGVATATTSSDHKLNAGQTVALTAASDPGVQGQFTTLAVPTSTTFTFTTDAADGSYTATLVGKTVEIDEPISYVSGPTLKAVTTQGRWTIAENPKSTQARVPETKQTHWDESDFTEQPYLRSCIVNDSMYLVNDTDEVKKYDGTSLYNAGIVPWQGWFFVNVDTSNEALVATRIRPFDNGTSDPATQTYFRVGSNTIKQGDRFKSSVTSKIYTAGTVAQDETADYLVYPVEKLDEVDASETTSSGNLTLANFYRYYVRLSMLDANRSRVHTATLGAEDMYVEYFDNCQIQLKLGGLPPFAEYDHDRIEIEIYRTKVNSVGPFYRVHRRLVDYGDLGGYILWTDTTDDDSLSDAQLDTQVNKFAGGIANQWTSVPLASAVTTANNQLVVGNIKSPPTLDIVFNQDTSVALAASDVNGKQLQLQLGTPAAGSETFNDSAVFQFRNAGNFEVAPTSELYVCEDGHDNTFTADNTTNIFTASGHNLKRGTRVRVSSAGTLPAGLDADTDYYVMPWVAGTPADEFKLASTFANAQSSDPDISFTTDGTGTHKVTVYGDHIILEPSTFGTDSISDGAWVYLFHSAAGTNNSLDFAGWHRTTYVFEDSGSGAVFINMAHNRVQNTDNGFGQSTDIDTVLLSTSSTFGVGERVPVWVGADGNLNQRGFADNSFETQLATKLGLAINAVMCSDAPSNPYWSSSNPAPWLMAQCGLSFGRGELQVDLVGQPSGTVNIQHDITSANLTVFVNNTSLAASTSRESEIRLFNSRIAASYPKFPEIFDNPYRDTLSDSVIDVNPADGQEITALIPFFGQSAFGDAQLSQVVVAFKTNSIYLVDLASGNTQKIQSRGQGCTSPRSVANTKDGIIFANKNGIWRIGWDMRVDWVGQMIKDLWDKDLDLEDQLEFAGHNYTQGKQYKLSVVSQGADYNTDVVVYNYGHEEAGRPGAWCQYTNHAATGWANQASEAFFGDQAGRVMKVRNYGTQADYRDNESPVAEQILETGGIDYGMPDSRKTTSSVTLQYQNDSTLTDVSVQTRHKLGDTYTSSTQVDLANDNQTIKYSLAQRRGTHLQVKVSKSGTKDESMGISRITARVADLGDAGVTEAASRS